MPFTLEKTEEIEAHLANNPYLSEGGLPGVEDARIFLALNRGLILFYLSVSGCDQDTSLPPLVQLHYQLLN